MAEWLERGWAHPAEQREVAVEGATVRYRAWQADPSLPVLLFVHGFQAHSHWWDHIAPHFAGRYRALALDFTGMGESDRRPAYSRRQYGREILAVLAREGGGAATLVSHSFGSVSTLYAAKLAPELAERVIVIDAHVYRAEDEPGDRRFPVRRYATIDEALSRYRLSPPGRWPVAEIVRYLARHSVRERSEGWEWKFDPEIVRSIHAERIRSELANIEVPVDLIYGEFSETVTPEALAGFREHLPQLGEPVMIPASHHHIMIEQPIALVAALRGLLASSRKQVSPASPPGPPGAPHPPGHG